MKKSTGPAAMAKGSPTKERQGKKIVPWGTERIKKRERPREMEKEREMMIRRRR